MNTTRGPRRWLALILGLLLLGSGLGCATLTYVTEVFRNDDGSHSAAVTLRTEIDAGVYAALEKGGEISSAPPESLPPGWTLSEADGGRTLALRREYASLDELQTVPAELAAAGGESGSIDFARALTVTVSEPTSGTLQYDFALDLLLPEPEAEEEEEAESDAASSLEGLNLDIDMDAIIDGYPGLREALAAAGPPTIAVEVYLPGRIDQAMVNGLADVVGEGVVESEFVGTGGVRWSFGFDQPGTYSLTASSRQGASADPIEERLNAAISGGLSVMEIADRLGVAEGAQMAALGPAGAVTAGLMAQIPAGLDSEARYQIEKTVWAAAVLAELEDGRGLPQMPTVRAAMPVVLRLAVKAGTEETARVALDRLVGLLINNDLGAR